MIKSFLKYNIFNNWYQNKKPLYNHSREMLQISKYVLIIHLYMYVRVTIPYESEIGSLTTILMCTLIFRSIIDNIL